MRGLSAQLHLTPVSAAVPPVGVTYTGVPEEWFWYGPDHRLHLAEGTAVWDCPDCYVRVMTEAGLPYRV